MADHQTSKQDTGNSSSSIDQDGEPVVWTEQEETNLRRKTDRHLMPLLWALFMYERLSAPSLKPLTHPILL